MMLRMLPGKLEGIPLVASVHVASTPAAALEAVDALPSPLAVVSDFNLKDPVNGMDLLALIGRKRPGSVRILMSGYSREQLGDVAASVHGFVEKPLRIEDMIPPIRRLLEKALSEAP